MTKRTSILNPTAHPDLRRSGRFSVCLAALSVAALACFACSTPRPDESNSSNDNDAASATAARYREYFKVNREAPPVLTLPRTALYGQPDFFGLLSDLTVTGHRVIVLDPRSPSGLALIDRRDGSIVRPDELSGALAGVTHPYPEREWCGASLTGIGAECGAEIQ